MLNSRVLILFIIVLIAAAARLLPHAPNFTPIAAMALFGGAYFTDKKLAFVLPLLAMIISDVFLGFHGVMTFVYLCFVITVYMGIRLRNKVSFIPVLGGVLGSSVLFFIVTNFGVWLTGSWYPRSVEGLIMCYTAAIPFFHYTLAGTMVYSAILFGGFELLQRKYPLLRYEKVRA
ncbi:MAG: DUF6580 family putative transport protein [Balneolales bacterium]